MSVVLSADILEVMGRGRYCTMLLDDWPVGSTVIDDLVVGEIVFKQVPVHFNFHDAERQLRECYVAIDMHGFDLAADWFVGKEVRSSRTNRGDC